MVAFIQLHPTLSLVWLLFFGLCIGSFLNVVIYRLPIMLNRDWRGQCLEFLNMPPDSAEQKVFNLLLPRSRCPRCEVVINWWENIPVISFLLLKGRCQNCDQKISWRYPIIEMLTALLTTYVVFKFGFTWFSAFALLYTWSLICLTVIDLDEQILPDHFTLPMLWLGLLLNLQNTLCPLPDAVIGATVGYMSLWLFTYLFKLITGKIGMGNGDFKLFALFGAWLGWQVLPFIIITASFLGAFIGISLIVLKLQSRDKPIPFGPFLAISGWVAFIWRPEVLQLMHQSLYF